MVFVLAFASGCGDSEEQERLAKAYPLLEGRTPRILIDEVVWYEGQCTMDKSGRTFEFSEGNKDWIWHKFINFHRSERPKIKVGGLVSVSWKPFSRNEIDPTLPPSRCNLRFKLDSEVNQGPADCVTFVKFWNDGEKQQTYYHRETATCIARVTKRETCFREEEYKPQPGEARSKKSAYVQTVPWQEKHKYEKCGHPQRQEYERQVFGSKWYDNW